MKAMERFAQFAVVLVVSHALWLSLVEIPEIQRNSLSLLLIWAFLPLVAMLLFLFPIALGVWKREKACGLRPAQIFGFTAILWALAALCLLSELHHTHGFLTWMGLFSLLDTLIQFGSLILLSLTFRALARGSLTNPSVLFRIALVGIGLSVFQNLLHAFGYVQNLALVLGPVPDTVVLTFFSQYPYQVALVAMIAAGLLHYRSLIPRRLRATPFRRLEIHLTGTMTILLLLAVGAWFHKTTDEPCGFSRAEAQMPRTRTALTDSIDLPDLVWVSVNKEGFQITKTPITLRQFRACVVAGHCWRSTFSERSDDSNCNWGHSGRDSHPMNCVDWYGATDFCRWVGGRLPHVEEWGKISEIPEMHHFIPDGDAALSSLPTSQTPELPQPRTWPVCSRPERPHAKGLCDTTGNVWEWTTVPESTFTVLRGGSWGNDLAWVVRVNGLTGATPLPPTRNYGTGFRCVR